MRKRPASSNKTGRGPGPKADLPGQLVLVFQGGGALGAYQAGVYEALHRAGLEPDWVVGTSIGAINGAIIAGNAVDHRLERLRAFWAGVQHHAFDAPPPWRPLTHALSTALVTTLGVPGFFRPNAAAMMGPKALLGVERASYYDTGDLSVTLSRLVDVDRLNARDPRFTVGAVAVKSGRMRYFDSHRETLGVPHVMASGALPPGFPAVLVDGEPYWDGGLYSNTPIEVVFDDFPRRDSVIIAVQLWDAEGAAPMTLEEVAEREKEIRYASRSDSHIARQQEKHELRHVIRALHQLMPKEIATRPEVEHLAAHGCHTQMHIVRLLAPHLATDDRFRDIDFTRGNIETRWQAGLEAGERMLAERPWTNPGDALHGVVIHDYR